MEISFDSNNLVIVSENETPEEALGELLANIFFTKTYDLNNTVIEKVLDFDYINEIISEKTYHIAENLITDSTRKLNTRVNYEEIGITKIFIAEEDYFAYETEINEYYNSKWNK